jgi:retron-type reverse transcriptase
MSFIKSDINYEHIISLENLLEAWKEFVLGKKSRKDVQEFQRNLMSNIISLHNDLVGKIYTHSAYEAFNISDPKPRNIHKAKVRDRLLHHALYRKMYPYFDKRFIHDSYSCRVGKGTHRAIKSFEKYARKVSKNNRGTVWILKCDIKKFFASIDHKILIEILGKYISDKNILWLLMQVVNSFHTTEQGKGLPLGNLTSQLLVNVYMNEFDQFAKHVIKAKYYIRYADDFVFLSDDRRVVENMLISVDLHLKEKLKLFLHPDKVFIKTYASGVDFLGWVHFPYCKILRTTSKRRMFSKLKINQSKETVQSYIGLISHGDTYKIREKIAGILDASSMS